MGQGNQRLFPEKVFGSSKLMVMNHVSVKIPNFIDFKSIIYVKMTFGFIYKIVFPNGKHYIGLTSTSLEQRTKEHKKNAKNGDVYCIYNAIRKYEMVDTLELIEIDTADTIEELCAKEIKYIIDYNSYYINGYGYNMTLGGEGTNGYVYTEENKQKMSEARQKYFEENPDAGKQHSERMKKNYEDPAARQKNSEAQKKRFKNPEARKQLSEAQKKYYEDPAARQKNSEARQKYFEENPDAGKQHGERMKKYHEDNPEARKQHSERKKKYFEDNPEAGKQHSEAVKKYYEDNPEARKELSERKKKYFEDNPEAGKQHSERLKKVSDRKGKNKLFDIFTKDGTFIKTCTYQIEAIEYLKKEHHITSTINISAVLCGKRKSSAGFVFKYK